MLAFLRFMLRERAVPLLLATLALVAWQRWGMETRLVVAPDTHGAAARDDSPDGGASVCAVDGVEQGWRLRYDIRPGVSWAFCGMNIDLVDPASGRGLDLSGYDTLVVFLSRATGPNDLFQIQLLSMDPSTYRESDPLTIKFLSMDLIPDTHRSRRNALPLSFFSVPTWWVARHHVPTVHQAPIRDDVRAVEVLTSNGKPPYGKGEVVVERIELRGKWIRQDPLLRIILGVWIALAFLYLGRQLFRSLRCERRLRDEASRFQELAGRDPLTATLNRRGFEDAFAALLARLEGSHPLGVLMVDLDHFKRINDTLGHGAGDDVLRQVALVLKAHLRAGDLCCRYGGEEFLLAIPGIDPERLRLLAERIRMAIELDVAVDSRNATASLGVAHGAMADVTDLVRRADDALYKAKENGRNRVESAC